MKNNGFTLAELLIAIAILGIIAVFTIPKVLNSSQNEEWNSTAKEVAGAISSAFSTYQLENTVTSNTSPKDLTQYFNYVSIDTSSIIDNIPVVGGTRSCSDSKPCLKMHNGGIVQFNDTDFSSTGFVRIWFDPDGINSGNEDTVNFILYPSGRLTTAAVINPLMDPAWFSWD